MIQTFIPGYRYTFIYTNHRGETKTRRVEFVGLDFGSNDWYPEEQWFMRTQDLDKFQTRSFALNKIDIGSIERI